MLIPIKALEGDGGRESLLLACARSGVFLSAPCGGGGKCGKCRVRIVEGRVSGQEPDREGWVLACAVEAASDLIIECPPNNVLGETETAPSQFFPGPDSPAPGAESPSPAVNSPPAAIGVALDIGTTTVSARLITPGAALDIVSELNAQSIFGADVMSRIGAAREGRTAELFKAINGQTQRLLKAFMEKWGLKKIDSLAVSGNTTMLHLFLNTDPSGMGEVPFSPVFLEEREIPGAELSLPADKVIILPSISAFVGGDLVAGLASLDLGRDLAGQAGDPPLGPALLIDIGTNGEMALVNSPLEPEKILCCSTAAGPAFEGAEISCGLGGVIGAISALSLGPDQKVSVTVIGNAAPRGISGSGLIDAVAVMLELGIIDETGYMENFPQGYPLAPGLSISPRDIRQFQLAKSAILSGIKILCKAGGLKPGDIKNVYIAGGLGFFINKSNAVRAGLLPAEFLDRITVSGNLSLRGAGEALFSGNFMEKCREIVRRSALIDLSADPDFMEEFAENMLFRAENILFRAENMLFGGQHD